MLAALIDGMDEGGAIRRRRRGRRQPRRRATTATAATATAPTSPSVLSDHRDVLGRRRPAADDAAPGPRQLRDRRGRQRRAARALRGQVGRDGDHRARGRLRLGRDPHHRRRSTATSTSSTARRSTSPPASAPTSSSSGRRSTRSRAARRSSRSSSSASNPGLKLDRLEHKLGIRASDTAALHPRRLPRPEGEPARQPRDRHRRRASPASCRRSTTPGRWSPRWRVGVARAALERTARAARPRPASRSTTTSPAAHADAPPPPSSSSMEADCEAALPADAAGRLDGRQPQAELARRPRWRRRRPAAPAPTSRCAAVELAGTVGYSRGRAAREVGARLRRSSTSSRAPSRSSC